MYMYTDAHRYTVIHKNTQIHAQTHPDKDKIDKHAHAHFQTQYTQKYTPKDA